MLTINSTKQNFSGNDIYFREQGFCQNQTLIKQLQELNEKMTGNERDSAIKELFEIEEELEQLQNEFENILEEKNKLKGKLEKIKIEMEEVEEENKELTNKLGNSENLIFQLRQEIEENKEKYELKIKEFKDLAEDLEPNKILNECNFTFNEASIEGNIFVNKPNKINKISNKNTCCENKCINSDNLSANKCKTGNGYVNVYENGMIKYRNKLPDEVGVERENEWICVYGQHQYLKPTNSGNINSLFYFEVTIYKELNSEICYAGVGFVGLEERMFLCNYSTTTWKDNQKFEWVEKDKTNLAFQLILAKLDLLTINSTKQNVSANYPTFENQTIIKQLQELNEKMKEFEKLNEENGKIFEEKLELLEELKDDKLEMIKMEKSWLKVNKKLEDSEYLICRLEKEIEENKENYEQEIKQKQQEEKIKYLELEEENKLNLIKIEEEFKELNKKLKNSENLIYQLRQEIGEIYLEKSELEDELHDALSEAKYETEKNNEGLLKQIKELNLEKTNVLVENNNLLTEIREKDEKISSLESQVKTSESTINSLNVKIAGLTAEWDKLNKENDKQRVVYVKRTNKINSIQNKNSCCGNKCINSNLSGGFCKNENGYVNVYENGLIKYINAWMGENKWISLNGQRPYTKASSYRPYFKAPSYSNNYCLFYFEVKMRDEFGAL
uniref:Uncharacterized protein n=1 Tax=Meloidogyne floridensis TaxID=298350 RepID=A0A915NHA0_9BILA